jgi:hypothetical protein
LAPSPSELAASLRFFVPSLANIALFLKEIPMTNYFGGVSNFFGIPSKFELGGTKFEMIPFPLQFDTRVTELVVSLRPHGTIFSVSIPVNCMLVPMNYEMVPFKGK